MIACGSIEELGKKLSSTIKQMLNCCIAGLLTWRGGFMFQASAQLSVPHPVTATTHNGVTFVPN